MTSILDTISALSEIMKEAGVYSANRVLPISLLIVHTLAYLIVAVWLMTTIGITPPWPYWGEFTTVYLGVVGICGTWISGNKLINSTRNTEKGKPGKPGLKLPDED